ncbi:MAG: hypothetical protein R2799_01375 [Crocinitomicaceae bacterium]
MQGAVAITHDYTLKLVDHNGKSLKNAWVSVEGYENRMQADEHGVIRFDFPQGVKENEITLYISFNYQHGEISIERTNTPITKEIRVELTEEILMGDIAPIEETPIEPVKKCEKKK